MRVMARITLPVESGNQAVRDGSVSTIVHRLVERWKPEALYFGGFDGQRTIFVVYDRDPCGRKPGRSGPGKPVL